MDAKFAGEQALRSHGIDYCIVRREDAAEAQGPLDSCSRSPLPPR